MLITSELLNQYDSHIDFLRTRPILEVFLDMDGVVSDWDRAACDLMGVDYDKIRWDGEEEAIEQFVDRDAINDKVNEGYDDFFATMPPFPHTEELMKVCEEANGIILTAPMKNCPGTYVGKVKWVRQYWPGTYRMIITHHKEACAKPTALLIDDRKSNCDAFLNAGGNAILFPSNVYDGNIDVETVIDFVRSISDFNSPNLFSRKE